MAEQKEFSKRKKLLLGVKSVFPIRKESWASLNEHILNGDRAAIDEWLNKRPYIGSKVKDVPRDILNPICTVAETGDLDIFDKLVEIGFSPLSEDLRKEEIKTSPKRRVLHLAAHNGHLDLVKKLVEVYGEDVNSYGGGNTCLQWAVLGRHEGVVKWLLSNGADPNIGDQMENDMLTVMKDSSNYHYWYNECYPIGKSFNRGLTEIVKMLVEAGADISKVRISGKTLISNFISNSNVREITYFLFKQAAFMPIRDLFEFVCNADFIKKKDEIIFIWQFLLDVNVSVHDLCNVPSHYSSPYKASSKKTSILQQISDSSMFGENSTLAEILSMSGSDTCAEGYQNFTDNLQTYLQSPTRRVCSLKQMSCLVVRQCLGHRISEKIDLLPVPDKIKCMVQLLMQK